MSSSIRSRIALHWGTVAVLLGVTLWMTFDESGFSALLRAFVPDADTVIYETRSLPKLMADQLLLTTAASVLALVIGALLGGFALSPTGRPFRDIIVNVGNLAQTVPSVAVMALAIPLTGYGSEPVILALVLYGILPIILNVIAGIEGVPRETVDAATGIGMSPRQRFFAVQLPLAWPVILGGIRNMVVINVSAATLGAVVAAGGLGMPILAGFQNYNNAFILEGALPAIALALLLDRLLSPAGVMRAQNG